MESVNENVIEWLKGDTVAAVTAPVSSKLKGMITRLHAKYPDEVKIIANNRDGSIFAHVPVDYVFIRKPKQINYSDEEKNKRSERLKKARDMT